ncbi:MAG TPA: hypothetical protein VMU24_06040 [Candidatus Acidoferrales bacterium]|nr:hypothetical protein [Candidatus Acidoferrales bacterium]
MKALLNKLAMRLLLVVFGAYVAFVGWSSFRQGQWVGFNAYRQEVWNLGTIGAGLLLACLALIPSRWIERFCSVRQKGVPLEHHDKRHHHSHSNS